MPGFCFGSFQVDSVIFDHSTKNAKVIFMSGYSYSGKINVIIRAGLFLLLLLSGTSGFARQVTLNPRVPLSSQIIYENTEYVIRRPISLNGETVIVPQGCTLMFRGRGQLSSGTIQGSETRIMSSKIKIFKDVALMGTFRSDASRPEWFDGVDNGDAIHLCTTFFQGAILDYDYTLHSPIVIGRPFAVSGKGRLSFGSGIGSCFEIESSRVSVKGIEILNQDIESTIIHVKGVQDRPLEDIVISQCSLTGSKFSIIFDYCDHGEISDCRISEVEHTAIGLYSSHFIQVLNNTISGINTNHRHSTSYGIAATYHYGDIKSTDIVISGNQVSNNPYWEALDTHGGERIFFSNNIVKNCWRGVAAVGDDHRDLMLCRDIVIENNDITCSDEPRTNGIAFSGVGVNNLSSGISVTGNKVHKSVLALYSNHNENVTISDNSLFATDEIWRDVGSRDVVFERNKVELAPGDALHYQKGVFYFKPTLTVANKSFGDLVNNTIMTKGASLIIQDGNFRSLNSSIREEDNRVINGTDE